MFSLGIKEFNRRIFSNLFIALQLAAVLFIIISIVSSVRSRIEYYEPIADQLKGEGLYAKLGGLATEEHFKEQFPQVESVFCAYSPALQINGIKTLKSYSQDVAEMYAPPLKEGKWISEIDVNSETIYAVVNEKSGFKIGDVVNGSFITYPPDDITYTNPIENKCKIEIIGIFSDKTKFLGGERYYEMGEDFRSLYGYGENKVFIMNKNQLQKIGINSTLSGEKMIIHFKDNLSEEEIADVSSKIRQYGATVNLQDFRDVSYMYVYHQLIQLLPILICIILLVVVSTIAISALNTKMSLHTYAIYYILGCTWKGCLVINFVNSLLTSICSVLMCTIFMNILKVTGKLQKTVITMGSYQLKWCGIMILAFVLISMLLPALFMRSTTPKEHLTSNE